MHLRATPPDPAASGPLAPDARAWLRRCFAAPAPPLLGMLLAAGMAHACGLLTPLGYQLVFDRVFSQGVEATLLVVIAALSGLALLEGACLGLRARYRIAWVEAVDARLRPGLLARLVQQPADRDRAGTVLGEAARLRSGVCGPLTDALLDLPLLGLLHLALWWLSPACALVAFVIGALLLLLQRAGAVGGRGGPAPEGALREAQSLAHAVVEGAPAWRALRAAGWVVEGFARVDGHARDLVATHDTRLAAGRERMQTLLRLQAVLLLGAGAHEVLAGRLSGGGLVACNLLAARMAQPWTRLLAGLEAIAQLRRSRGLLHGLLRGALLPVRTPLTGQDSPGAGAGPLDALGGPLVFEAFGVDDAASPLSASFAPGSRIELATACPSLRTRTFGACLGEVGHRGAARVETPGRRSLPLAEAATGLAAGLPLLPASLRLNLALHEPAPPDARLLGALEDAGLLGWFSRLADGLEAWPDATWPLRDGAFRLRLALARALVRSPRVLVWELAADEARQAEACGLFRQLGLSRPALTVIVVGGDAGSPLAGFRRHALDPAAVLHTGAGADDARDDRARALAALAAGTR